MFFQKQVIKPSKHRTTQHGGREGEQEQGTMCYCEATVCFSPAIDRQRFSAAIVRELCDVWSTMNAATFVTDEQNALSLCPAEETANLVAVRIRGFSLRHMETHTYLRSSTPSDVQSDMYPKDAVLCRVRQCEPWSTCLK